MTLLFGVLCRYLRVLHGLVPDAAKADRDVEGSRDLIASYLLKQEVSYCFSNSPVRMHPLTMCCGLLYRRSPSRAWRRGCCR